MWLLLEKAKKEKHSLTIKELEKLIPYLSEKYYNQEALVEDQFFDDLVDELKIRNKDSKILKNIGAPVRKDVEKVKLPVWMGSLDKVKPNTRELSLWLERYNQELMISDKLDGISALIAYDKEGNVSLFTRGDGQVGQDISYLAPYFDFPILKKVVYIRGELILSKRNFRDKYSKFYPKARSVVAGIVNSKKPSLEILKDVEFLAYELIDPNTTFIISEQFNIMSKLGFNCAFREKIVQGNQDDFIQILKERKKDSQYEVDGLVVAANQIYHRNNKNNPKYAVAFKVNETGIITNVLAVEWQASKHGILIPRLKFEPIILDGDTVQYCTAFHANFIRDNKVGKGSKIRVVKSGDVIPYVTEVVKSTQAYFPDLKYHWNETEIDIILDEDDENVEIKKLTNFFKVLEIEGVSEGTVKKMLKAGFDDIDKIYNASADNFLKLSHFQEKSAKKLYDNIHNVMDKNISLAKLMTASLVFGFGFGQRRLTLLINSLPHILDKEDLSLPEIINVEGFSQITAEQFLDKYENFWSWLEKYPFLNYEKKIKKDKEEGEYTGQYIVITGFRDNSLEAKIKSQGGTLQDNVNSKTTLVLAKDINKSSSKLKKATNLKIPIKEYN